MENRLLQREIGGDHGKFHAWPSDPRPQGQKDPLLAAAARKVSPVEHLLQLGLLMNAATSCLQQMAVCHTYSAHMQYMQSAKLHLPGGKLMTT